MDLQAIWIVLKNTGIGGVLSYLSLEGAKREQEINIQTLSLGEAANLGISKDKAEENSSKQFGDLLSRFTKR